MTAPLPPNGARFRSPERTGKWPAVRLVAVAYWTVVVLAAATAVAAVRTLDRFRSDSARVAHTQEVIAAINELRTAMTDVQVGVRGFVITGVESYLEQSRVASAAAPGELNVLQRLVADNPLQMRRLLAVGELIDRRIDLAARLADTRRREGFAAAQNELVRGEGVAPSDQIRAILSEVATEERRLLDVRQHESQSRARIALTMLLLFGGLVAVIVGVGAVRIRREVKAQTAALRREGESRRVSEGRYRRLVESNVIGVMIADTAGRVAEANDRWLTMVGYAREELDAGTVRWDTITPPEWNAVDQRAADQLLTTGVATPFEKEYLHKDGHRVPIRATVAMLEGHAREAICLVEDLTERRRIEAVLRESESDYRRLFEWAADGVFVSDARGRYQEVNGAGCRMLGYSRDELLTMSIEDIVVPEEQARVPVELDRLAVDVLVGTAWRFRRKDGSTFDGAVTASVLPDGRVFAIVRDVSDLHRAVTELRDRERLLTESQRIGHVGSWALDKAGNITWSDEAYRIFDVPLETRPLTTGIVMDRVHPDDRERLQAWTAACLAGASVGPLDIRCIPTDGSVRFLTGSGELHRDAAGRPEYVAGTVLDITERRQVELALHKSQARTELMVDAANIGMWERNYATDEMFLSPEWKRQLGYADDELPNAMETWESRMHPDDLASVQSAIAALRTGTSRSEDRECRLRHRDGSWRTMFVRATATRNEAGDVVGLMGCHLDVTDQRRTAEERRQVYERIGAGVSALDRDWNFTFANETMAQQTHTAVEELIGRNFWTLFPEAVGSEFDLAFRQALESQRPTRAEGFYEPLARWFETRAYPDEEGLTIFSVDITERKRTEMALGESQARTQLLVSASHIGLWDWDLITHAVYFSPEWKRQLGYADDELPDRFEEWESRLHPDDLERTVGSVKDYLDGRRASYDVEFRLQHKDGSWRHILANADVVRDGAGTPVRMMGCHVDVTEQRRAADERRKIFERITDAFVALDQDWIYTYVNDKAASIFGRRAEDLVGKHIWTEFPEGVGQPFDLAYRKAMADQKPIHFEEYYPPYDRWFENRIYPSPEGLSIYFHDVTERKRTEAEIRASQQQLRALADRLNTAREEESKRIARELHDELGQQLTALKLELARLEPKRPRAASKQRSQWSHLNALVDRTIEVVQHVSGELRLGHLDILGVTAALEWQGQEFQRTSGIECTVQVPDEVEGLSDAQSTAVFRVAQEALTNVARHAQATAVTVTLTRERARLTLAVSDNGRGVTAEESNARDALGLLGMRERALAAGGTLDITGAPRKGTTVRMTLTLGADAPTGT